MPAFSLVSTHSKCSIKAYCVFSWFKKADFFKKKCTQAVGIWKEEGQDFALLQGTGVGLVRGSRKRKEVEVCLEGCIGG